MLTVGEQAGSGGPHLVRHPTAPVSVLADMGHDVGVTGQVRFGVLGAARIAPSALIAPARDDAEVTVVAVAARDVQRAKAFAARHGIADVHSTYEELLADPGIDAVYIPSPNGLHGRWTKAALAAGKHVLCEKPFAANAAEARDVADAAGDRVVMEAFHYRYHPVAARMAEIVGSGELGPLRTVETSFCFPLPRFSDIRYRLDLAGGALMDAGCYAVHMARLLGGAEPEVRSARARLLRPGVDRAMRAELRFPGGHTGTVLCSMWSSDVLRITARVVGERGELRVLNPLAPHIYHRISVRTDAGRRVEHLSRRHTYAFQLDAFAAAVLRGAPVLTGPDDSIANMAVIDACYRASGLSPREPS
jgi:predicted dehydrogenase